jgi:hypothetical protein
MDLKISSRDARQGCQTEGGRQAVAYQHYHGQGDMQMVNRASARTLVASPILGFAAP